MSDEPKLLPQSFIEGVKAYGVDKPCTCLWLQWSETDTDGVKWMVNDPAISDPLCELHPNGLENSDA